jgi:hypothetical protein
VPEESSASSHLGSDLEVKSASKWVSWEVDVLLVNEPRLVQSVVASPEDNMSVVRDVVAVNIKAVTTTVSQVSSVTWEE